MKKWILFPFAIMACGLLATSWYPFGRFTQLNIPGQAILYSIDPDHQHRKDHFESRWDVENGPMPEYEYFHAWRVIGKTEIVEENQRRELIESLNTDLRTRRTPARCFNPRHALRLIDNEQTIDVLICFECGLIQVHPNELAVSNRIANGSETLFNKLLQNAGVALAPKSGEHSP